VTDYLRFVVTLAAVVDPFLAVPFFLGCTSGRDAGERARLSRIIAITVFLVLSGSAFGGELLLRTIGASLPAFRVAGGLVLLLMALAMLNAQAGAMRQTSVEVQELESGDVAGVVPLAFPLLAGPGAISTAIIAGQEGGAMHRLMIVAGIGVVCLITWLVLRNAHLIAARLSATGMNIATRILGLLLGAMAVQFMAEGLKELFPGLAG
jgi:multiple antibiotic resistance protein